MLNLDIQTELWENQTNFYAIANSSSGARYKINFVPVGNAPQKGLQVGTGYFLQHSNYPALIALENTMIIPSKPPAPIQ
jgi:hypothetical protein